MMRAFAPLIALIVGCGGPLAEGPAPRLAAAPQGETLALHFVADGPFGTDLDQVIDWYLGTNTGIRRARAGEAVANVYLSTAGQPNWAGDCTVTLRAVGSDGSPVADGTCKHYCGWPHRHREGVIATTRWVLEETLFALMRRGRGAGAVREQRPAATTVEPSPAIQAPASSVRRATAVAVIVGVERYRAELPAAAGAERDAKLFAEFAEHTLGVPRDRIELLTGEAATKSGIEARIHEWLPRNAARGAEVFFFFAGQGAPDPVKGKRYLVPWDADARYIASQGIDIDGLLEKLGRLPAAHVYAFLDSCFSGAGGRSVLSPGTRPIIIERPITNKPRGPVLVFSATGPQETTGSLAGHGLFSYSLLRGLAGEADTNRDGVIKLRELVDYTRRSVATEASRQNRDQHPSFAGSSEDVVLTRLPLRR